MQTKKLKIFFGVIYKKLKQDTGLAVVLFATLSLIFSSLFAITAPIFWGADEPAHFARAYEIAHGNFKTDKVPAGEVQKSIGVNAESLGGYIPKNTKDSIDLAYSEITSEPVHKGGFGQIKSIKKYNDTNNMTQSGQKKVFIYPGSAANTPVPYAPMVPVLIVAEKMNLSIKSTVISTRLVSLFISTTITIIAILILKESRMKWLIIITALMPTVVFQSSTLSTDGITNAFMFIFSALIIKSLFLNIHLRKTELAILCITLVLMPLLKSNLLFISPLALLIVFKSTTDRVRRIGLVASMIIGVLIFVAWLKINPNITDTLGVLRGDKNVSNILPHAQLTYMFGHIVDLVKIFIRTVLLADNYYINSMVGVLGFSMIQIPFVAILSTFVATGVAIFNLEKIRVSKIRLMYISVFVILFISSVFATLYYTFTQYRYEVVEGIQGRYFIPVLPLVLVLIGIFVSRIRSYNKLYRHAPLIMSTAMFLTLSLSSIKYLYVIWG